MGGRGGIMLQQGYVHYDRLKKKKKPPTTYPVNFANLLKKGSKKE